MRTGVIVAALLGLTTFPSGAAALDCPPPADLSSTDRIVGLTEFWRTAELAFAWFDQVPDLDWSAAYRDAVPEAAGAEDLLDYYRTMQRTAALLQDGHTGITLPDALARGCLVDAPPVMLAAVGGDAVVVDTDAALADALPLGSVVIAVDDLPTGEKLARDVLPYLATSSPHVRRYFAISGWSYQLLGLLYGPAGSDAVLTVRTPDGTVRDVTVLRDRFAREEAVPWVRPEADDPAGPVTLTWRGDVAVVALSDFADERTPALFEALLPALREAKGLVLDLSDNGGGSTEIGTAVLGHLIDRPAPGSSWRVRAHVPVYEAWAAYGDEDYAAYAGGAWETGQHDTLEPMPPSEQLVLPTAIVTSWYTASAAEDFAVYARSQPHVTFVGEATFGSTGQPVSIELPGGGSARISAKRDAYPDGTDFVGVGVLPDVEVLPSAQDVVSRRNPALDRAVALVREAGR